MPKGIYTRRRRVTEEHIKMRKRKWRMNYMKVNPIKRLLWAAKRRAKIRHLEFDITDDDIYIPEFCPYLGLKLVTHTPRGQNRYCSISLDRIDNTKGYIKGNIEVISHLANSMKNGATKEQLICFAKRILTNA